MAVTSLGHVLLFVRREFWLGYIVLFLVLYAPVMVAAQASKDADHESKDVDGQSGRKEAQTEEPDN